MNTIEFNTKYQKLLTDKHYGLDIDNQEVIDYLDNRFEETFSKIEGFEYQQIKLKFGRCCFYANLQTLFGSEMARKIESEVEEDINTIISKQKPTTIFPTDDKCPLTRGVK